MIRTRALLCSLLALVASATAAPAQSPPEVLSVEQLAARIDRHLAALWQARGVQPAPLVNDSTFFRRVHLDLAGRIPSITRAKDFLDDPDPHKRRQWVEELLTHKEYRHLYVGHFASVWRAWLLEGVPGEHQAAYGPMLEAWLAKRMGANLRYDALVRELLVVPMDRLEGASASAFYGAHDYKVEELAGSVSRFFLGVRLECAQCHNHPFAKWTKQQFWEFAAFFSELRPLAQNESDSAAKPKPSTPGTITIPGTEQVVRARFLGSAMPLPERAAPRAALADWMAARDNPFFARALANRLWAWFFGTSLAGPAEESGEQSVPELVALLDELSRQLILHDYDVTYLIRAMVSSQAYQRSSKLTHPSQDSPRLFARMAVRGLTAEQLFASLAEATGRDPQQDLTDTSLQLFDEFGVRTPRTEFLAKFTSLDSATERTTSILQALFLMNGKLVTDATTLERNTVLTTVADSKSSTERKIAELYLVTLSRPPRPAEQARLVAYVDRGGASNDARKALADVFWALLNSAEFMLNH